MNQYSSIQQPPNQGFNNNMGAAPIENETLGKWELDTDPFLNRTYHELLGQKLEGGLWVDDPSRQRIMNELGASEFITDISSRVSIHMQMSSLSDRDVKEIASYAAEIFADKVEDNWKEWDINPSKSSFTSICLKMYDILYIMLRISMNGNMLRHREHKGQTVLNHSSPQEAMI